MLNSPGNMCFGQFALRHRSNGSRALPPSSKRMRDASEVNKDHQDKRYLTALSRGHAKREGIDRENDIGHPIYAALSRGLSNSAFLQGLK